MSVYVIGTVVHVLAFFLICQAVSTSHSLISSNPRAVGSQVAALLFLSSTRTTMHHIYSSSDSRSVRICSRASNFPGAVDIQGSARKRYLEKVTLDSGFFAFIITFLT